MADLDAELVEIVRAHPGLMHVLTTLRDVDLPDRSRSRGQAGQPRQHPVFGAPAYRLDTGAQDVGPGRE